MLTYTLPFFGSTYAAENGARVIVTLLRLIQDKIGDCNVCRWRREVEYSIAGVNGHLDGYVLAFSSGRQGSQAKNGRDRR